MRNTITILVLLLFVLSGCERTPQYRIGVSQCLDDAWREKMNKEMERELLLHPEMSLSKRIAYGSNELQCAQIDSFISERVDLLIVSPNEAEQVKPAVTRAYRAGIPVIVADRRVTGEEWTAFIGGDNYRVGALMAEWVKGVERQKTANAQRQKTAALKDKRQKTAALKDKRQKITGDFEVGSAGYGTHLLEVVGLPGSTPATLRHQGMMDGLAEVVGEIEIHSVMGNWLQEDAYAVVGEYLRSHPLPDLIVAQNDLMAIGASEAVRADSRYRPGCVRVMGVDGIKPGLQAIMDGVIECTATYFSRGDMVIATAAHILSGEPFVRDTVIATMMVDATAANALLTQHNERLHDLEALQIVQKRSDARWQAMRRDWARLIAVIVLVALLFVAALVTLLLMLKRQNSEIRQEILPKLEEVEQTMETIQLSQRDLAFAERMKQIVDEHLNDPNLNVEFLGSKLHLSRTQIFRRVKTVTGKGPLEYIRERRLIRAGELLRSTDMTVQQVAAELCFSSPGYFTKCYKEYFGKLPSERG